MKKMTRIVFVPGLLMLCLGLAWVPASSAGVSVGVGINLPAYTFEAEPELVVIPGTYAYTVPDAGVDIVFYQGFWYRPFEGRWYRARGYNGPWGFVERRRVPGFFHRLPPDYRHHHPGYDRIRYGDFRKNWRGWERNRHWDKHHDNWRRGGHDRGSGDHDRGRGDHDGRRRY